MFGYHNSGACGLDLWAPGTRSVAENRAFSSYCQYSSKIEDIIELIINHINLGIYNVTIKNWNNLSSREQEYIQKEVTKRINGY